MENNLLAGWLGIPGHDHDLGACTNDHGPQESLRIIGHRNTLAYSTQCVGPERGRLPAGDRTIVRNGNRGSLRYGFYPV